LAEEPTDHGFDRGVEVDDCFTGPNGVVSGTTRGPAWPELRMAGAVYLEHGFTASLPAATRPACPPPGDSGQACEYTTAVYWPGSGDLRAGSRCWPPRRH
jgi:hypothetical protein